MTVEMPVEYVEWVHALAAIERFISKNRQALLEEIIRELPKSKGIEQEGLIYDLYKKIGWNDYWNAAHEALLDRLEQEREGK